MNSACRLICVLSVVLLTGACASMHPDAKPASQVQSMVPGTPKEVANALVEEMARRQFALTAQGDGFLSFDRPIDNAALWPKLDGAPGNLPHARVMITLTPVGEATRVAADMMIIAAPGKANERLVQVSALGIDPRIGDILNDTQASVIAERGSSDPRVAFAVAPVTR